MPYHLIVDALVDAVRQDRMAHAAHHRRVAAARNAHDNESGRPGRFVSMGRRRKLRRSEATV